jgi:predicted enzyme related to lactoylglutathione lyase
VGFSAGLPEPAGGYQVFVYSEQGGGGIRQPSSGEAPGSTPTGYVDDTDQAYRAALAAGAESVAEPHDIMPGVRIALVRAPGGVLFGLSGPTA